MSTDFVERCRELYEANDNPLYLWLALSSAAVRSDAPLPSWIMDYLRSSADALRRLKSDHKPPPGKVLEALGIVRGNWNAFVEWRKDETAVWTALDYAAFGGGDRAAEELAHERGAKFPNEVDAAMQKVRRRVKRARQRPPPARWLGLPHSGDGPTADAVMAGRPPARQDRWLGKAQRRFPETARAASDPGRGPRRRGVASPADGRRRPPARPRRIGGSPPSGPAAA